MKRLIQREFVVDASVETAWDHLANVTGWPSWARHIKRIDVTPPGPLSMATHGVIHLKPAMKSEFAMSEINPPAGWKWSGSFFSITVHDDHQFAPVDAERCRLVWIVDVEGFGASVLGPLFAWVYCRNLNRAIPRLISEMKAKSVP